MPPATTAATPPNSVTVTSTTPKHEPIEFTIAKTGADTGSIRIKTWQPGHPTSAAPDFNDGYDLSDIQASATGTKLVCRGKAGFISPSVTCTVNRVDGHVPSFVRVAIKSGPFGTTLDYPISDADQARLTQFIAHAGFPVLSA